ncbi:MAG: hypothetical protein C6W58_15635 [Bacillaceae bacterium]|nr:MAG: hypothetical protein C6W58_15635 [Bacillaceae bacterium]
MSIYLFISEKIKLNSCLLSAFFGTLFVKNNKNSIIFIWFYSKRLLILEPVYSLQNFCKVHKPMLVKCDKKTPKAMAILEEGFKDAMAVLDYPNCYR